MTIQAPESARERRRLRTRRELAATAVRLFEDRGFASTTVEEIADAADYSASTFFRMFERKEDAVFFDMPDRLYALRAEFDSATGPPTWAHVRDALVDHARSWEENDPEFAAARVRLFHRESALSARYLEYCQEYEDWVAELVARQRGTDPQRDVVARLLAGCVVAALRAAFRVQTASVTVAAGDSVVVHLEHALDALESGGLPALMAQT